MYILFIESSFWYYYREQIEYKNCSTIINLALLSIVQVTQNDGILWKKIAMKRKILIRIAELFREQMNVVNHHALRCLWRRQKTLRCTPNLSIIWDINIKIFRYSGWTIWGIVRTYYKSYHYFKIINPIISDIQSNNLK